MTRRKYPVVVEAILALAVQEEPADAPEGPVATLNRWLSREAVSGRFVRVDQHVGLNAGPVYMAAFSNLPATLLLEAVALQPWRAPSRIQVFLREAPDKALVGLSGLRMIVAARCAAAAGTPNWWNVPGAVVAAMEMEPPAQGY